jgi:hypothetical protein
MGLFVAICVGLGLAAACGLRVFVPLFAVSVAMKWGFMSGGTATQASPAFEWMGSNAAVALFGIAAVVELVGYLFRWVDHLLDILAVPLAAAAGALLLTSQLTALVAVPGADGADPTLVPLMHPALAWGVGILLGALVAVGVETASIVGRLSSSVLTIGWLNPLYGMVESILALAVTLLTIFAPVLVGLVVMLFVPILLLAAWRFLAWRRKQRRVREQKLLEARERIAKSMARHSHKLAGDSPSPGDSPA